MATRIQQYDDRLVSSKLLHVHMFWHMSRSLVSSVHGDDFTTAGSKPELNRLESELGAKYELRQGGRTVPGKDDDKEGRVLNRVARWIADRLEYEVDPRQAEKLIESNRLSGEGVKSTVTPGLKPTSEQIDGEK